MCCDVTKIFRLIKTLGKHHLKQIMEQKYIIAMDLCKKSYPFEQRTSYAMPILLNLAIKMIYITKLYIIKVIYRYYQQ